MADMFLVYSDYASYDDFRKDIHFVTQDELKAKQYCDKYNRIGKKLKRFYAELYWGGRIAKFHEERVGTISDKYYKWGDFIRCAYVKVKSR